MLEDRDNGADIRTGLTFYLEDINSLLCFEGGDAWEILEGIFKWIADGRCKELELTDRQWRVFNTLVDKHEKRVTEHRANKEKQRERVNKRWQKAKERKEVIPR